MKVLSKTKREAPALPELSLAEKIKNTQAEAEAFIERHVDGLKASPDGQLLPRDWLMLDTKLQHGRCVCQCALSLTGDKKQ
jgi:hypothetical protein